MDITTRFTYKYIHKTTSHRRQRGCCSSSTHCLSFPQCMYCGLSKFDINMLIKGKWSSHTQSIRELFALYYKSLVILVLRKHWLCLSFAETHLQQKVSSNTCLCQFCFVWIGHGLFYSSWIVYTPSSSPKNTALWHLTLQFGESDLVPLIHIAWCLGYTGIPSSILIVSCYEAKAKNMEKAMCSNTLIPGITRVNHRRFST